MGGKGSGRPKGNVKYKTEEERRQAILESKRKYNKAHREERVAYMKQWRKKKRKGYDEISIKGYKTFCLS